MEEGQTNPQGAQRPRMAFIPVAYSNQPALNDGAFPYPAGAHPQAGAPTHVGPQPGMIIQQPPAYVYVQQPMPVVGAISHADLDSHFTGCCGCHVKTCVSIIGIVEAIGLIIALICGISFYNQASWDYVLHIYMIICIVAFVIGAIALACLFYGVQRERGGWLVPHMVCETVAIIGLFIGAIIYIRVAILIGSVDWHGYDYSAVYSLAIVFAIIFVIAAILEISFLQQVAKCYRYLKVKHHGVRW